MGPCMGVKVAQSAPSISHLLLADGLMLFMRANQWEVAVINIYWNNTRGGLGRM